MPTKIRTISQPHSPPESEHEKNAYYHREALRLALGSILAPKRTFTPSSSRSASGTSSPAYPTHFSNTASSPSPPSPPNPTPAFGQSRGYWDNHGHWDAHLYPHPHPHPHYPSRLGMSRTNSSASVSTSNSAAGSPVLMSPAIAPSQLPSEQHPPLPPPADVPGIMISPSTPPIHAPTPVQPAAPASILPNAPSMTEAPVPRPPPPDGLTGVGDNHQLKGKWIKKLDTKSSAWDALIHGSFS